MRDQHEKKPHYLFNKVSRLVVSSMEMMSEREAETRNEWVEKFASPNLAWISAEKLDWEYLTWMPV